MTAFPLTSSGKVKKFELKEQLIKELGLGTPQSSERHSNVRLIWTSRQFALNDHQISARRRLLMERMNRGTGSVGRSLLRREPKRRHACDSH
jgi:hypothetical protein